MKGRKFGFTLIELLVSLTIMSIMMGLALVAFQSSRKSARDARRKADLEEIRSALEMYHADNGAYPGERWCDSSIGSCDTACPCMPPGSDWNGTIQTELEPDYIRDLPKDPINDATYYYYYEPSGDTYWLRAKLETTSSWYYVYNP